MSESMMRTGGPVLLLILVLFQVTPVLARSDDLIQREIEAQIAGSTMLRDTLIEVHVEQRLVVLTGQVRLYEQKLISDRIAWTTLGVFEVDNEIRVVPKVPAGGCGNRTEDQGDRENRRALPWCRGGGRG